MPWSVKHVKGGPKPWKVVKSDTGEVVGSSATKEMAQASVRARYHFTAQKEALGHLAGRK